MYQLSLVHDVPRCVSYLACCQQNQCISLCSRAEIENTRIVQCFSKRGDSLNERQHGSNDRHKSPLENSIAFYSFCFIIKVNKYYYSCVNHLKHRYYVYHVTLLSAHLFNRSVDIHYCIVVNRPYI